MKHSGCVNSDDRFFFAGNVVFRPCKEGWLVISVESANWIVLRNDFQKELLQHLIEGKTVGDIFEYITSESQVNDLKYLLSAITAREFAKTESIPVCQYLEGYKMLNCYLTNACNLKCEHCFMHSGIKLKDELSKEEWMRVLSEFKQEGGESVTFSGGEPLMNKDFDEIVGHASKLGLSITVLSNGVLWEEKEIQKIGPLINEIQISLDGVDEESNSKVRGRGHFEKIIATIVNFANLGIRTSVATTFTLSNLQDDTANRYLKLIEDIKNQTKEPVFFKLSKKILQGRNTQYTEVQNRYFYDRIIEIERGIDPNSQYNNFMEGHTPNLVARNCGYGGISVGADGEVYFCNRISELETYGNVRDNSLKYFMNIGHELHLQTSVDNLHPCVNCHLRYICCGGCRIDECNFQGRLRHFMKPLKQIKCTSKTIEQLERKMIDGFTYYYNF